MCCFFFLTLCKIINAPLYPKKSLTLLSKKEVAISSLNHTYYKDRFMSGRRIKSGGTF
jgi:hypothetical protein